MDIKHVLYFSPNFTFAEIDFDNEESVIKAFEDRMEGYYLDPAQVMNDRCKWFGAGVLVISAIDAIARIVTGNKKKSGLRFITWLKQSVKEFEESDPKNNGKTLADRFWNEFRCGLLHEGRIKDGGQFSYRFEEVVKVDKVTFVNPKCILSRLRTAFRMYLIKVHKDHVERERLRNFLRKDFETEIKLGKH